MCVLDSEEEHQHQHKLNNFKNRSPPPAPAKAMIAVSCSKEQLQIGDAEDDAMTTTTTGSLNSSSVEDQSSVKSVESSSLASPPPLRPPNSKIKIMCSYGGRILPRPHDGQLRYVGGETRILLWQRCISYAEMMVKLVALVGRNVAVKYQLPNEDLDALISVVCEEDFGSMIDEYVKMEGRDCSARLRLFLFFLPAAAAAASSPRAAVESRSLDQQFIEALNGMPASNGGGRVSRGAASDEDTECGGGVAKPGPIKMHRQLSASDRIESGSSRRVSPRTSPRAHGQLLQQQEAGVVSFQQLARENSSAGRAVAEMIDPMMIHHYYPAPDPCSRQAAQQFFASDPPPPPPPPAVPGEPLKGVHHEGESPKKPDNQEGGGGIHAPPNSYVCVKDLSRCQGAEMVVNRQYNVHHRHGLPAICEPQVYPVVPCSCRETRAGKPGPSPSRFRDGQQQQQQQQMFHEQVDDSRSLLLRPVLVPSQPQQVYEPVHHHHRLAAEKNGSRLSDLDRQHHMNHHQHHQHHQQQQQQHHRAAATNELVNCTMV